jgi:hypothetical protein
VDFHISIGVFHFLYTHIKYLSVFLVQLEKTGYLRTLPFSLNTLPPTAASVALPSSSTAGSRTLPATRTVALPPQIRKCPSHSSHIEWRNITELYSFLTSVTLLIEWRGGGDFFSAKSPFPNLCGNFPIPSSFSDFFLSLQSSRYVPLTSACSTCQREKV